MFHLSNCTTTGSHDSHIKFWEKREKFQQALDTQFPPSLYKYIGRVSLHDLINRRACQRSGMAHSTGVAWRDRVSLEDLLGAVLGDANSNARFRFAFCQPPKAPSLEWFPNYIFKKACQGLRATSLPKVAALPLLFEPSRRQLLPATRRDLIGRVSLHDLINRRACQRSGMAHSTGVAWRDRVSLEDLLGAVLGDANSNARFRFAFCQPPKAPSLEWFPNYIFKKACQGLRATSLPKVAALPLLFEPSRRQLLPATRRDLIGLRAVFVELAMQIATPLS